EPFRHRRLVIPGRWNAHARGARPDGNFPLPPREVALGSGQPLPATRITEARDVVNQRRLDREAVTPALAEALGLRGLKRAAETDPGVAHRDHDSLPPEAAAEVVDVDRDPSPGPGV